ncbi:nuclear transport factor 2 family protein [Chitinophaga lutea]
MKQISLVLFFSSLLQLASAQSKDQASLDKALESLRKAMMDGDKASLERLTAPTLSYGHSNGRLEDRAEFIDNLVTGKSDFVTLDLTAQTVSITGNVAVVRHKLDAKTNDGGKPGEAHLHVLQVWSKTGGAWKLLARQAVKVPPAS